ncbi:MAG: hypothetical protein ACRC1D_10495 [Culicoidibacterales bacterium]
MNEFLEAIEMRVELRFTYKKKTYHVGYTYEGEEVILYESYNENSLRKFSNIKEALENFSISGTKLRQIIPLVDIDYY